VRDIQNGRETGI
jgi:hypothetical protein